MIANRKPPPRPNQKLSVPAPQSSQKAPVPVPRRVIADAVAPPKPTPVVPIAIKPQAAEEYKPQPAQVVPPTQLIGAPSIRERYATKGNAPQVSSQSPLVASAAAAEQSTGGMSITDIVALVQQAVLADENKGGALHLHLHSPIHIHLQKAKL